MIAGSFPTYAGTCIQDCNDNLFERPPNENNDSPWRRLNSNNKYVRENTNIELMRTQAIGFKKHGLTIARAKDGFPVRTGDTSFRFEVRDGDCGYNPPPLVNDCLSKRERHELAQRTIFDGEFWLSYSIFVGDDFEPIQHYSGVAYDTATVLGQLYNWPKKPPGIDLSMQMLFYGTKKGYEAANFIGDYDDTGPALIIPREQFYGKWNDILIHINPVSSTDGFIRIYVNGAPEPKFNYEGAVTRPTVTSTFKFGVYRYGLDESIIHPTQVAFYDNIFAHKQCEQVHKELKFDCDKIKREEQKINAVRSPKFVACGEGL